MRHRTCLVDMQYTHIVSENWQVLIIGVQFVKKLL